MERRKRKEPIDRLKENLDFLQEMIENPTRYGAYVMIKKTHDAKTKIPINVNLLDLKIEVEQKIRELNFKIYKKLGLDEVPDGIKRQ
jgi:hypothetical protein